MVYFYCRVTILVDDYFILDTYYLDKNNQAILKYVFCYYIKSIRTMNRFINDYYTKYIELRDYTDVLDLLLLSFIQVFEPSFYKIMHENEDKLKSVNGSIRDDFIKSKISDDLKQKNIQYIINIIFNSDHIAYKSQPKFIDSNPKRIAKNFDIYFSLFEDNKFIFPSMKLVQDSIQNKDKLKSFFENMKKSDRYVDIINSFLFELNLIFFTYDTYHEDNIIKCLDIYEDIYEYDKYLITSLNFFMSNMIFSKNNKDKPFYYLAGILNDDNYFHEFILKLKEILKKSKDPVYITIYTLSNLDRDFTRSWMERYKDFYEKDCNIQIIMKKISDEFIKEIDTIDKLCRYEDLNFLDVLFKNNNEFMKFFNAKIEDENTRNIYLIKFITIYILISYDAEGINYYKVHAHKYHGSLPINRQYISDLLNSDIFFSSIEEDLQLLIITFHFSVLDIRNYRESYPEPELKEELTKLENDYKNKHGSLPKKENILTFYINRNRKN